MKDLQLCRQALSGVKTRAEWACLLHCMCHVLCISSQFRSVKSLPDQVIYCAADSAKALKRMHRETGRQVIHVQNEDSHTMPNQQVLQHASKTGLSKVIMS